MIGYAAICPLCFAEGVTGLYVLLLTLSACLTPQSATPVKSDLPVICLSVSTCGVVLCTEQHQRRTSAGGPKTRQVSAGACSDFARIKSIPAARHEASTVSTSLYVSGNSIWVSPNTTLNALCGNARWTTSRVAILSFPPEKAT